MEKSYTFTSPIPEHKRNHRTPESYEITIIFAGKDNSALENAKDIIIGQQAKVLNIEV